MTKKQQTKDKQENKRQERTIKDDKRQQKTQQKTIKDNKRQ
jgi:hypothetical protein